MLDLDRYVPAFITFIANKLSNSATAFYQKNFGVNVTEWRIMSLLAIEPGIPGLAHLPRDRVRQGAGQPHAVGVAKARPGHDPDRAGRRTHPFDFADREGARDP